MMMTGAVSSFLTLQRCAHCCRRGQVTTFRFDRNLPQTCCALALTIRDVFKYVTIILNKTAGELEREEIQLALQDLGLPSTGPAVE
jgi:hypothetical protein